MSATAALGAFGLEADESDFDSVAAIDAKTNRVVRDIPVGNTPTAVAVGAGSVWVLNSNERTVSRIDPATKAGRSFPSREVSRTCPDLYSTRRAGVWATTSVAGGSPWRSAPVRASKACQLRSSS